MQSRSVAAVIVIAAAIGLGIWALAGRAQVPSSNKLQVCATIAPIADWVREVGGDDVDVHCLVDGSKDPHHFEPTPQDAQRISASRAVFAVGLDLDPWVEPFAKNAGRGEKLSVFKTGDWITPRKLEHHEIEIGEKDGHDKEHGHTHDHGIDPHYWQDPRRAMTVVGKITDELIKLDPKNKDDYEIRRERYMRSLKVLDALIEEAAKAIPEKQRLVTFHDAYGYLFDRLHIQVAAVVQVTPGVEPSLKDCADVMRAIQSTGQKFIYKEPSGSDRAIEKIAGEAFAKKIEILDPLDNELSSVGKNYEERLKHNILVLVRTLVEPEKVKDLEGKSKFDRDWVP